MGWREGDDRCGGEKVMIDVVERGDDDEGDDGAERR